MRSVLSELLGGFFFLHKYVLVVPACLPMCEHTYTQRPEADTRSLSQLFATLFLGAHILS